MSNHQMQHIYLDNNATTAVDPRVLEAVIKELKEPASNPSSVHFYGRAARARLMKARDFIAHHFHVKSQEVIFTSGGTEGLNMMIRGVATTHSGTIISSNAEHAAVYETLKGLQSQGRDVVFLKTGTYGAITPEQLIQALTPDCRMIVLMAANNETGVKTDIAAIAKIAEERNIALIVDGVAWLGKELFTVPKGVAAICFSGHKIHAPKGVGFVIVRQSLKWEGLFKGGEQEYAKRGGTENLPGIIGLAEAIKVMSKELPEASQRMKQLRDKFERTILEKISGVSINGQGERICNTSNISFAGVDGEALLALLDMEGIAVSHGSACAAGASDPSRILLDMDLSMDRARSSLRFSLSRYTTEEEVDRAADCIIRLLHKTS